jgi:adenosylcobinamide-phosphate synthase
MSWTFAAALLLDLVLGDPHGWPHPVIGIGRFVKRFELVLAGLFDNRRLAGSILALGTLVMTAGLTWLVLLLAEAIHPLLGLVVMIWLGYTTLSLRALHVESRAVVQQLQCGNLEEARRMLAMLVGRDTSGLDAEGILKACIEAIAENSSTGVVGPLFYLIFGGPVLAMVFKAAATLDAMVGFTDDSGHEMGWASARLDDLLNLIPARLTALLLVLAAFPLGLNPWAAFRVILRDARKPASVNAGFPEAAMAGALGIELGGPAVYFGQRVDKPTLGDADRPVTVASYRAAIRLMYLACLVLVASGLVLLAPLN